MSKPTKPTLKNAVLAKCQSCMGHWADGVIDCTNYTCPLYSWQIRADKSKADLTWMKYNPKRKGLVTWEECEREITDEERAAMSERLKDIRSKHSASVDDIDVVKQDENWDEEL